MKGKLIGLGISLPICGIASVFLSSLIHLLMSQQWEGTSQLSWNMCMERIKMDKQVGMIALTVFVMSFALIAMMVLMLGANKTGYKSELRSITDKISTPIPYGEKQHGSACWLKKEEYGKAFEIVSVASSQEPLAMLCKQGKDDLEFYKQEKEKAKIEGKGKSEESEETKGHEEAGENGKHEGHEEAEENGKHEGHEEAEGKSKRD